MAAEGISTSLPLPPVLRFGGNLAFASGTQRTPASRGVPHRAARARGRRFQILPPNSSERNIEVNASGDAEEIDGDGNVEVTEREGTAILVLLCLSKL